MKTRICCEVSARGEHTFSLIHGGQAYYLFKQNYRRGVEKYFGKGVLLDEAMNFAKSHHDCAVERTMTKIPMFIKYVEKEYGIQVFERTKRKYGHHGAGLVPCV